MTDRYTSQPAIFFRPNNLRLEICATAWAMIQAFVQRTPDAPEAGGVLLGRHLRDGSAIIVDAVTTPMAGDRRSRTRFYRARRRHQAAIDTAWRDSDGTCTYLGEWHTHPESVPTPSPIDWADWQRRLRDDRYTEPLFFLILGISETRTWQGWRRGVIEPLQALTTPMVHFDNIDSLGYES
jgi:integrative and conjugative element protein (TIGR02256 family)